MNRSHVLKFFVALTGIGLILFVLLVSVSGQVLYSPSPEETTLRRKVSIHQRMQEMSTWPPTPDTPLYPLRMVRDQIRLFLATKDTKPMLELKLATDRLDSAKKLLVHHRPALALTTLTKSTKYVLSAAREINENTPKSSNPVRANAEKYIHTQIEQLQRLKPSFSDEQKAVIDRLILELNALRDQFI